MANETRIVTKNSTAITDTPSDLLAGELAVNLPDKRLFVGPVGGGAGVALNDADGISYNNSSSGLVANTVQTAIDELAAYTSTAMPIGSIVMFSGTITAIPANWAICDGTNPTPDLSGKFVIGTAIQGDIGNTGGSANAVVVDHTHTGVAATAGQHTHTVDVWPQAADLSGGPSGASNGAGVTGAAGNHSHTLTIDNAGSSGVDANLPPYYTLAYIMRVS